MHLKIKSSWSKLCRFVFHLKAKLGDFIGQMTKTLEGASPKQSFWHSLSNVRFANATRIISDVITMSQILKDVASPWLCARCTM